MSGTWVDACGVGDIDTEDLIRFDHGDRTYALYRTSDDRYFATDGLCTHAKVHLSGGFLSGTTIECPKHNGRFDIVTGTPKGAPVTTALGCHPVEVRGSRVWLRID